MTLSDYKQTLHAVAAQRIDDQFELWVQEWKTIVGPREPLAQHLAKRALGGRFYTRADMERDMAGAGD